MSGRIWTRVTRGILVFAFLLSSVPTSWSDEEAATDDQGSPQILRSETVESGLFFLNGEFIEAPYTIETTSESLSVNGNSWPVKPIAFHGQFSDDFNQGVRGRGMGDGSGFRNNRSGNESRTEGRPPNSDARPRTRFAPNGNFMIRRMTQQIVDALNNDQLVFVFEETQEVVAMTSPVAPDLLEILLTGQHTDAQLQQVVLTARNPRTRELLTEWLKSYSPPERLHSLLTARQDERTQREIANQRQIDAVHRLDNYSYPLTLLGMLVGVVSLGHLLRWPRKEEAAEAGSETVRAVGIALCLMFVMALIDLVWTILATQAGMMKEVNPLAQKLVDTPLQLAIFKTSATAVGFGIFYTWRKRRQIQVATWWMCLVCVLVTFRWVIFDSAMSP